SARCIRPPHEIRGSSRLGTDAARANRETPHSSPPPLTHGGLTTHTDANPPRIAGASANGALSGGVDARQPPSLQAAGNPGQRGRDPGSALGPIVAEMTSS